MTEALETIERARGHLYSFHQLVGEADLALDGALASLHECGATELAERLRTDLVGRNVLPGRWTYHVFEAEMKQRRRTHGRPGHQMRPG